MKPDWKDAPEWARWLAMDDDGSWWWYSIRPKNYGAYFGLRGKVGRVESALTYDNVDMDREPFEFSLEARP